MGKRCAICGELVDPSPRAMETGICGRCSGDLPEDVQKCFDGSPCDRPDGDCNKCRWMR